MKNEKFLTVIFRFFFTVLLSFGFLLPILGVSGFLPISGKAIPIILLVSLILAVSGISKSLSVSAAILLPAGIIIWLFFASGYTIVTEVARAFTLQLRGVDYALSLVSEEAILLLAAAFTFLSFPMTLKKTGSWLSLLCSAAVALLLWLKDAPEFLIYLLPALAASFTLFILDRHPGTPVHRIFPFVFLIVISAFLLTPKEGIISADLKQFADNLRQNIMDRLFYTEPRDVFSLSSEGFYPQGSSQLGGPVTPSDHPVMQVSAPRDVYLRGVILNEYTGRCWKNTISGRRYLWDSRTQKNQRINIFDQSLPATSIDGKLISPATVSVRMLSSNASTIFLPQRIRDLIPGGELIAYYSPSSEIFSTRNLQAGDTWSVQAPLFVAGDPGLDTLIFSLSNTDDAHYDGVADQYTSLPDHLEQPVTDLAYSITSGLSSPYEKAFAIQSWLSRNYRYTLDVAEHPSDIDFVTNFLLNTKEGYCTYFASAMTVLCRICGLPARYIEGYLAEIDSSGQALVSGLNAHAWTEVYFNGFGWLTFDATPRHKSNSSSTVSLADPDVNTPEPPSPSPVPDDPFFESSNRYSVPTPADTDEQTPEHEEQKKEQSAQPDKHTSKKSLFSWWMLIPVFVILCIIFRFIITSPDYLEKRCRTNRERFVIWTADVSKLLRAAGIFRRPGETPMAFARRLDAEDRFNVSFALFGECVSLCLYGNVEPIESDISLIRDTSILLSNELSIFVRARYYVTRIFKFKRESDLI